ncbi:unnamed protein product [Meganyctiphanes norvegica]|uniref:Glypican-6 n=1 Tax=Meganyctiphanes norvegica TaxID=48144 RepID=A0AAV2Q831_MEGNR
MALSRMCSSPLSSWLLLSLLLVGCLLLQLQEGHALKSCQGVQQHLARQGPLRDEVVPDQPIPGDHLKMCVGTTTCCTEMMESKLSIGSTLEFDNNMKKNLNPLANLLDKKKRKFDEFFHNLLNYSRTSFDTTFVKTYGILYKQNKHVFTDLYDNLEDYYNKGQLDLQEAMNGFFKKLYQILFAVYNSQYQFTPKYLRCITRHMEEVQPFGNVSVKLTSQIKRSFMALRTFVQGLATVRDVVRSVLKINPSLPPCVHELMKMSKCAMCAGELGVHPCKPYCLDVVDNCLVHHKPLVQHWHAYVDAMVQVGERLENPFNIENVVKPINYKVSDAIMNFQEAGHEISNKIFHECGQPQLGGWMRNKRQVSAGEPEISFESLDFSGSRQDSRDQNTDTIGHLVHEIKTKIQNSRNFWDELPIKMCSEARRQDDSNCWTGTAVGMYEAKDGQSLNNSSADNSQMNGQIMRLTVITEKLKEAYFGRDVSWINEATMEAGTTDNGSCPIGFEEISNSQKTKKKKKEKAVATISLQTLL